MLLSAQVIRVRNNRLVGCRETRSGNRPDHVEAETGKCEVEIVKAVQTSPDEMPKIDCDIICSNACSTSISVKGRYGPFIFHPAVSNHNIVNENIVNAQDLLTC